jgi:hypothetical protein
MKGCHEGKESKLQVLNFLEQGQNWITIEHSRSINGMDNGTVKNELALGSIFT